MMLKLITVDTSIKNNKGKENFKMTINNNQVIRQNISVKFSECIKISMPPEALLSGVFFCISGLSPEN